LTKHVTLIDVAYAGSPLLLKKNMVAQISFISNQ